MVWEAKSLMGLKVNHDDFNAANFLDWWSVVASMRELSIVFRGIYRMYRKRMKQNPKKSACNRLDLESQGSWSTIYTQKLLGH